MRSRWMRKFGSLSSRPIASMRCARSRTALAFSNDSAADVSEFTTDTAVLSVLLERAADRIDQVLRLWQLGGVVTGGLLGSDFHMCVGRHQLIRDLDPFHD